MGALCGKEQDHAYQVSRKDFLAIKTSSIMKDYEYIKQLGFGSFGEVKLARNRKTKVQFAIKKINVDPKDTELVEMIHNEITTLIKCVLFAHSQPEFQDHPNIIGIVDAYKEPKLTYIVEEYIENCKEVTHIFENEGSFNEGNRIVAVEQILRALNYMHTNNLVHRDLKVENVIYAPLEDPTDLTNVQLKLIDFGFAKGSKSNTLDLDEFVGTPYYVPPEIVNGQKYGNKCDIWSLGVMVYKFIANDYPFNGKNRAELFDKISQGNVRFSHPIWKEVSNECKSFIQQCLTVEQATRPSAKSLLQHQWIKNKPNGFHITLQHQKTFSNKMSENMKTMKKMDNFQYSIISYMNQLNLYQTELNDLRQQFVAVDKNGDGTLTFDEVTDILKAHVGSEDLEEFKEILKKIDSDRSGQIDYSEFINLTIEKKKLLSKENLTITFKTLDIDGSGYLTIDELRKSFEAGGNKKSKKFWTEFMASIDENNDGQISLEEFINAMEKLIAH